MLWFRIRMRYKPGEEDFHSHDIRQYLWYQGQFGERFLNDCETSETEGRNGLTEICMPNLDSACPKTYKPIKPIILTIFKNFPFNIKEGTIPNRPMQPFGHSVRLFGHLVIRPIQGTEATQIDSDPQIQIYGSIEDSVLRHLYYNSIFHDMQYCSADRTF